MEDQPARVHFPGFAPFLAPASNRGYLPFQWFHPLYIRQLATESSQSVSFSSFDRYELPERL
jgi:hypothetical protein